MSKTLYRDYDRAALDREYDNRNKVPGFDFEAFLDRYHALSEQARRQRRCFLDVGYGPAEAERLDIFPAEEEERSATEIFFHGGYWRLLDKKDFSYIAHGLVPHGRTVVIPNYALIPSVGMDELVDQCRRAVAWVYQNISAFGGDPRRLYLSGHSAGGHLVAMMLATNWRRFGLNFSGELFRGACAISGIYDLEPVRLSFLNDTLRLTPEIVERNSPIRLRPLWNGAPAIVVGAKEGDEYIRQSRDFSNAWTTGNCIPRFSTLPDADHFSIREELGDPTSRMVSMIVGPSEA